MNDILPVIISAIVFFALSTFIALFVILYQRRQLKFKRTTEQLKSEFSQQLLQSQLEIQEYSFNKIGQELHDNVGQLLTTAKLLLGVIEVGIQQNKMSETAGALKTASQTLSTALQELRLLSKSLNHDWLYQFDLLHNLRLEKERINIARDVQVRLICTHDKLPINSEAQVMLFRVAQEALQNAIKHAKAKDICMQVDCNEAGLQLVIEDDGVGFDAVALKKESLGLRNMEHRIQLLGGTIEWKTGAGHGTAVIICIPQDKLKTP